MAKAFAPLIQASAVELEAALQHRGALEIDGCWRVMSAALLGDTLEVLLLTAAQQGWGSRILVAEAGQAMSADGFDPRQGFSTSCHYTYDRLVIIVPQHDGAAAYLSRARATHGS